MISTVANKEYPDVTMPNPRGARRKTAIVGGGILGMQLATRLQADGDDVTLYEAAPHIGGLADAWQVGDITWDRHYHVFLLSDLRTRLLIESLGLTSDVVWKETRTGFYTNGTLYSMSNTKEFLKFPPLRFFDKLRLGATILGASKIRNWQYLEQMTAVEWLRKWSGRRTTEQIWLPLLRAKLGEHALEASAAFIWAIIARMYAARKSGLKKEMFGYVRGGYAKVQQRFEEQLRQANITIRTSTPIRAIQKAHSNGCIIGLSDGTTEDYDRVVVTTAGPLAAKLCPELLPREKAKLYGLTYQGIVCPSVVLKKPLAQFYVTNLTDPGLPFTAVIEMTALVDPEEFKGKHLVYLPKYVSPKDALFDQTDEAIRESFLTALYKLYPHVTPADVLAFQVSRARHVLAISTLNYTANLPPMTTSIPGLFLINSAHISHSTLNVNDTLLLADRAAGLFANGVLA